MAGNLTDKLVKILTGESAGKYRRVSARSGSKLIRDGEAEMVFVVGEAQNRKKLESTARSTGEKAVQESAEAR